MRILMIEDNNDHAMLVRRLLSNPGLDTALSHAETLSEAVIQLESHQEFDVILSDMSLPDAQGVECLEAISKVSKVAASLPVVVLTSLDDEASALAMLRYGAQDYIVKDGMTAKSLTTALRYAIQRHDVDSENRRLVKELGEAKSLLERKNKRLSRLYDTAQKFVENISHEFRTPLSVIKEFSSLLREHVVGSVNDEQERMLHIIEDRTDDLNTMVDDMLDSGKLEAGVMGLCRKPHDLELLIHRATRQLSRKASLKGVDLIIHPINSDCNVYCDDEKVGRIITNLVVNGIKYTGTGGSVELSTAVDPGDSEARVTVSDNGPGIDAKQLEIIFKRFEQLGEEVHGSCRGVGLGLGIAKELADLNLGELEVASTPGQGSQFSFTLPLAIPSVVIERQQKRLLLSNAAATLTAILVEPQGDHVDHLNDDVEAFLNCLLRGDDLLFRLRDDRWLFVMAVPDMETQLFTDRLEATRQRANRNRPLTPLPALSVQSLGRWRASEPPLAALTSLLDFVHLTNESQPTREVVYA